jgi:hypothetical protein
MEDRYTTSDLLPCPRCNAGETRWQFKHLSPRMSGPGQMISAEIIHACPRSAGCHRINTIITGRTREDVVDLWNKRT